MKHRGILGSLSDAVLLCENSTCALVYYSLCSSEWRLFVL